MRIANITFGVLRSSVTRAQRSSFCAVLESLHAGVVEGAACFERGDQQFLLRIQCLLHLRMGCGILHISSVDQSNRAVSLVLLHPYVLRYY
jgi:hypothetical protein